MTPGKIPTMRRQLPQTLAVMSLMTCLAGVALVMRDREARITLGSRSTEYLLVVLACDGGAFEMCPVSTGTAGLGQDEVDVGFLGWRYEQSATSSAGASH